MTTNLLYFMFCYENRELLRYIRQLRCTGTLVLKIYTLTIIFYEKKELFIDIDI